MFYLAGFSSLTDSFNGGAKDHRAASYSAIVMIYLYAVSYASSWNLSWIICSEIFPNKIRSFCLVFTTCSQWLGQFIVVYSTPYMVANITYGTFLFFGCMTILAILFIFFLIPETKGVPLEDMDLLWNARGFAISKRRQYMTAKALMGEPQSVSEKGQDSEHVDHVTEMKV